MSNWADQQEYEVPTDFIYKSHLFKPLETNSRSTKGKVIMVYRCIQCGCVKLYNKSNLQSEYLHNGSTILKAPECKYNPKQDEELKRFGQNPPRVPKKKTFEELMRD